MSNTRSDDHGDGLCVLCVVGEEEFISCCYCPSEARLRTNCILIPNVSDKKKAVGHEI